MEGLPGGLRTLLKAAKQFWDPYPFMRYMRRRRLVFIHVPKTGGTAFLRAIGAEDSRMHIPWQVFWQANRFRFMEYAKLAVVRNPYDRLVSVYAYLLQGGSPHSPTPLAAHLNENYPNFPSFVEEYLEPSRLVMHNLLRPQVFFLCDVMGEVMVDHLCRFEQLDQDMARMFDVLDLPAARLPKVNASVREHALHSVYTPAMADRVYELYREDFRVFGYGRELPGGR